MTININPEDVKIFEENGFSKEKVGSTINHYRELGLSDDEIQLKIDARLDGWKNTQPEQSKTKIDLSPSGMTRRLASATVAPFYANKKNIPLTQAYKELRQIQENMPRNLVENTLDLSASLALPATKAIKGASLASKIRNSVLTGAYQGGLIGGIESLRDKGDLSGADSGAKIGGALGGGLGALSPQFAKIGNKLKEGMTKAPFAEKVGNTLEVLTSVPKDYSKLALENELAGNSIFQGKFNKDTVYQPIERKLRLAKDVLPSKESFAQEFYNLGNKAVEGMQAIKDKASSEISEVLGNLNNREVQNNGIKNAVNGVINSFGEGGVYNSAQRNAPRVINLLNDVLPQEGLTLRDLHRLKGDLYDIGYQSAGAREGTQAEVARGTAEQINNYLRGVAPEYKAPNERFSLITDLERGLDNENTIAKKIKGIGSENNIITGLDQKLKNIDTLLPVENKFYDRAKNIINSEEEINTIRNLIGKQYERNPKLLANRTDEKFEQALEDLQNRTNVSFMDDLEKIRAREAFENWTSGQGGGSGSTQGMANFSRQELAKILKEAVRPITSSAVGYGLGGLPGAAIGFSLASPKVMGQGTIKGLGKIYNNLGKEVPDWILNRMGVVGGYMSQPLYGTVNFNEYNY